MANKIIKTKKVHYCFYIMNGNEPFYERKIYVKKIHLYADNIFVKK